MIEKGVRIVLGTTQLAVARIAARLGSQVANNNTASAECGGTTISFKQRTCVRKEINSKRCDAKASHGRAAVLLWSILCKYKPLFVTKYTHSACTTFNVIHNFL